MNITRLPVDELTCAGYLTSFGKLKLSVTLEGVEPGELCIQMDDELREAVAEQLADFDATELNELRFAVDYVLSRHAGVSMPKLSRLKTRLDLLCGANKGEAA